MKKVLVLFTVIMLVFCTMFSLVACGDEDIDALKQTIEDLKAQIADLQNNYGSSNVEDLNHR